MKVLSENGNVQTVKFASPDFQLEAARLMLRVYTAERVRQPDGSWTLLGSTARQVTSYPVHDGIRVDPATLAAIPEPAPGVAPEGGAPAYSFIMSSTAESLGLSGMGQPIYPAIAAMVERFLEVNGVF